MVRQSRLFAAACAAFFLALLGNSQSFAITLTAQGGGAGAGCTGFTSTSSTPFSGSQSCSNLANPTFAAQGDVASSASAGHVGAAVNVLSFGSAAGTHMQGKGIYTHILFFSFSTPSLLK